MIFKKLRRLVLFVATGLFVALAIPAFAAKPAPVSGSIELMAGPAALAAADGGDVAYGGNAQFDARVEGKIGKQDKVYITVVCFQDGKVVYQASGATTHSFVIEDQAGQGLDWNGPNAECTGNLMYKDGGGKKYTISQLASTGFTVAG